jgi:SAM-dependent methyltransferase
LLFVSFLVRIDFRYERSAQSGNLSDGGGFIGGLPVNCPLCSNGRSAPFWRDARRRYRRCSRCALVFVPPQYRLSPDEEKREYDLHRNSPRDAGYRAFLGRLFFPLAARLRPGAAGLDFGSGPGPTLSGMFAEAGFRMAIYDPYYAPDKRVLQFSYDFITCSEVVEHLFHPGRDLAALYRMLLPGGRLGVMTKLVIDRRAFARWHYKNDPTHVSFFSRKTFRFLAEHLGANLEFCGRDVILLQKPEVF